MVGFISIYEIPPPLCPLEPAIDLMGRLGNLLFLQQQYVPRKIFNKRRGAIRLDAGEKEELFKHLENMLKTLKFGSITLIVQDGRIVQIEKNEKVRLKSNKNR